MRRIWGPFDFWHQPEVKLKRIRHVLYAFILTYYLPFCNNLAPILAMFTVAYTCGFQLFLFKPAQFFLETTMIDCCMYTQIAKFDWPSSFRYGYISWYIVFQRKCFNRSLFNPTSMHALGGYTILTGYVDWLTMIIVDVLIFRIQLTILLRFSLCLRSVAYTFKFHLLYPITFVVCIWRIHCPWVNVQGVINKDRRAAWFALYITLCYLCPTVSFSVPTNLFYFGGENELSSVFSIRRFRWA